MNETSSGDLKSIMHSKRANVYYLERCRVLVNGGRVEYVTDAGKRALYWNIPIANTTSVLLGGGTSITQAAMRELAKAGVMVGFCGSGGTPLFSANEADCEVLWFSPQSEYRPTGYLQAWMRMWSDAERRLNTAKRMQEVRLESIRLHWKRANADFGIELSSGLEQLLGSARLAIAGSSTTEELLLEEARLTKRLYKLVCRAVGYGEFARAKRGGGTDPANRFLDQGNYLAYGLAATATWVLGLPHGLAVLHGKTRRGALVFDVADLVKDALVLPQAFVSAMRGDDEQQFRSALVQRFTRAEALDSMIETLKELADESSGEVP